MLDIIGLLYHNVDRYTHRKDVIKLRLTESELQIMELFWNAEKSLSCPDVLRLAPDEKSWKDNSIYIMLQGLQKKEAIKEIGAVKGDKGKYLRLFEPMLSRQEYFARQLKGTLDSKSLPMLFSALVKDTELDDEAIAELEKILEKKKSELTKKKK